ncbi:MAG TPA: SH3 domain-containing protein [Candidatus Angelobacter sp.]|nr:SH3 domain-containing protein [Candidatus Angelobacter sp.]
MCKSHSIERVPSLRHGPAAVLIVAVVLVCLLAGCSGRGGASGNAEYAYVAVTEASLRDHVATLYTKTGVVHNGERLQVLERMQSKRFLRVRSPRGEEGWVQERFLADQATFEQFQRLTEQFKSTPAQATATTEEQVKVHVLPGRKTGYLYLLNEKQKVDMLQRQTVDRNAAPLQLKDDKQKDADDTPDEDKVKSDNAGPPAVREDWWLVRDAQARVGWVLGRTLYLSVPEEIAQYSEGQRIVAAFPLDEVTDGDKKVAEYLVLFTEKEGLPYDFSQARVFTWNVRKHRYETAYRERDLAGVLPVTLGRQGFEKEGNLRTFVLRTKEDDGSVRDRTYKFNPPIVRRVLAAGETPPAPRRHKAQKAGGKSKSKH